MRDEINSGDTQKLSEEEIGLMMMIDRCNYLVRQIQGLVNHIADMNNVEFSPLYVERPLKDEGPLCILYQGEYEREINLNCDLPGRSLRNSNSFLGRMFRRLRQVFL